MRGRPLLVTLLAVAVAGCASNVAPVYTRGHGVPAPQAATSDYHVVRPGDTLYSISWRHGVDYRSVARWNRIDPPYVIHPGQRLRLAAPQRGVASQPQPAARHETAQPTPSQKKPAPAPTVAQSLSAAAISWRRPTDGRLTRRFSADAQGKRGIELSGTLGQPITAAAGGRVVYAGSGLRGYGNLIIVKHNGRYLTAYGYNREILVKEGDMVNAGQQIATMGTGPSQQPSLHFELRRDGKPVDPLTYLSVN
jgi:lipoprotein NlpD